MKEKGKKKKKEPMNYTYHKRRLLNRELKRQFPDIPWQENAQGNPRMRTSVLPQGAKRMMIIEQFEKAAIDYYHENRQPIPLLVLMPAICKGSQEEYDVNYVNPRSGTSMQLAEKLVGQGRVFFID